jgi:hypothetical protein
MSDIGLSYDASTQPSSVDVTFGLSFSGTTLRASVKDVEAFIIRLTPSGNVSELILSGIAWPLAQFLGAILPPMASSLIDGITFDVVSISPLKQNIAGHDFTISLGNLGFSNHNGMLMVNGSVNIS